MFRFGEHFNCSFFRPREGEGDDAAVDDLLLLRVVDLVLREEALQV